MTLRSFDNYIIVSSENRNKILCRLNEILPQIDRCIAAFVRMIDINERGDKIMSEKINNFDPIIYFYKINTFNHEINWLKEQKKDVIDAIKNISDAHETFMMLLANKLLRVEFRIY